MTIGCLPKNTIRAKARELWFYFLRSEEQNYYNTSL